MSQHNESPEDVAGGPGEAFGQRKVTTNRLREMKAAGVPIAALTAYESRNGLKVGVWVSLGRASLTLLIVHVVLFREISRWEVLGWWSAFDANPALFGTLAAIAVAAVLSVLWGKVGYRFGAEWLLRKVAG